MFLSDISIKRPILMTMVLLVFVLFGGLAYFGLNLELTPKIDIPYVTVQTIYPGGGPQEIETQISKKVEDAVSTLSGIKEITSYSMEAVSYVVVEFEMGKDVAIATQETREKVDAILNDLPDDAEKPVIEKIEVGSEPIIDIVLEGDRTPIELYELADKKLKTRLAQIDGVARIDISGGQEREIVVEFDNRIVFQNSLSLVQLSQILAAENIELPGGHFTKKDQEIAARTNAKFSTVDELKEFEVPTAKGKKKLRNLANIYDTGTEVREKSTYFNNVENVKKDNIVLLSLVKSSDANAVKISKILNKKLDDIEDTLPDDCHLTIVKDNSDFIKASVEDTLMNIGLGILLTALVLIFFLHDIRSTIIAALAMPMSIISTFMLMQWAGFSLNILSLMGLSTSVGILVANSVVVLENIFRHKMMGKNRTNAAAKGTAEVTVAVLASTLTNIVVFLPIANMSSMVGQFFEEFALTVTFATIFSLIVSFTLTPMLASLILSEGNGKKHPVGEKLEKVFASWENWYGAFLSKVFKSEIRSAVILIAAAGLLVVSFMFAGNLGTEFMPIMDQGDVAVEIELPLGYNLEQTSKTVKDVEEIIIKRDEVKQIVTCIGKINSINVGTNLAKLNVKLIDADERELSSSQVADKFINDLSNVPNAILRVSAVSSSSENASMMKPIDFNLQGDDNALLEKYKKHIVAELKNVDGIINVNTSSRSGKPEITLTPKRDKIADLGITAYDLALNLRSAMEGFTLTTFKEKGEEYDIRVAMDENSVDSPEKIANLAVVTRNGIMRMSQLADIKFTDGYSKITHKDKMRSIQISADLASGYVLSDVVAKVNERLDNIEMENGYSILWGGSTELMNEAMADMMQAFIIAIVLTYMLLAAILESFTQPIMILGTVPLALIGVIWGLLIADISIGISAMMAIVMLIGLVVNNAILILDYSNLLIKKGKSVAESLVEAGKAKLKPILMSTLAIMLGMLPMAAGIGSAGAETRQPMGMVSIGGLLASMFLTLIVIPVIVQLTQKDKAVKEKV